MYFLNEARIQKNLCHVVVRVCAGWSSGFHTRDLAALLFRKEV
jgi:hypothetical protein